MESAVNEVICKCKHVTMVDIEKALHSHNKFEDVEKEFDEVQKITGCSTGCGGCHDKIMNVISEIISG
ncbi:MAG: (2Fe-2S)-binding protein [Oscillospiraceae bacterium]|jgi:NAD(P)H-nitrite reductase large subunit|nr:MAG: (2Fe-2S)-binding protein [Oscillospiraceae bacterium]